MPGAVRNLSDAVTARMTNGISQVTYYDAEIVANPPTEMYVVGYPDAGNPFQARHGDVATGLDWGTTYVCVGRSRGQVATCVDNVRGRNRGWTPDVLGGTWVEQGIGARIIPTDTDSDDPRFSFTLRYTLTTRS